MEQEALTLESRIVRTETKVNDLHEDIKDIKKELRWAVGLIFSINTTIIGLLAKGFNII